MTSRVIYSTMIAKEAESLFPISDFMLETLTAKHTLSILFTPTSYMLNRKCIQL